MTSFQLLFPCQKSTKQLCKAKHSVVNPALVSTACNCTEKTVLLVLPTTELVINISNGNGVIIFD